MIAADLLGMLLIVSVIPFCHFVGFVKGRWRGAMALSLAVSSHAILVFLSAAEIVRPAAADNLVFHNRAVGYSNGSRIFEFSGPTSHLWSYAISHFYEFFGSSIWLGYAVNQWIYVFFLIQLLKFCDDTGLGRYRWIVVVAFSLLPSVLLFGNFLLREPFQLLCLVVAVRHMERFRRFGRGWSLILTTSALVPFGAIHSGFFLFAPIALGGAIIARLFLPPAGQRVRRVPGGALAGVMLGVALLSGSVVAVGSFSEHRRVAQVTEGDIDLAESIEDVAAERGRTAFAWRPPVTGFGGLVYSPVHLFQFLFAPLVPFMIREPQDLIAAIDTGIRFLMLYGIFVVYRRGNTDTKRMILFLLGTYFVFCLVASLGTLTVGTAMRHHLKVFWIIIALGMPGLFMRRAAVRVRRPWSRPPMPTRLPTPRISPR